MILGFQGEKESGADKRPLLSSSHGSMIRTRLINRGGSKVDGKLLLLLLDQGREEKRFRAARFSFQSLSARSIAIPNTNIQNGNEDFFREFSISFSTKGRGNQRSECGPFLLLLLLLLLLGCVAMRHAITTYQTSRGRRKEEKSHGPVAARWLAFKRCSVSKEEHKGRWCQRGELENDEERERERHGDESKGVDVGNQAVEARGMFEKTAIE